VKAGQFSWWDYRAGASAATQAGIDHHHLTPALQAGASLIFLPESFQNQRSCTSGYNCDILELTSTFACPGLHINRRFAPYPSVSSNGMLQVSSVYFSRRIINHPISTHNLGNHSLLSQIFFGTLTPQPLQFVWYFVGQLFITSPTFSALTLSIDRKRRPTSIIYISLVLASP